MSLFSRFISSGSNVFRRSLQAALVVVLIAGMGCSTLFSPGDPPVRLHFSPVYEQKPQGNNKTRKQQLVVTRPSVPAELGGDSIVMLLNQRELQRLAGYRWASTIPDMMQRSIIAGIESTGAFASVADERSGITARMRLLCDIDQFVLRYQEDPQKKANRSVPPSAVIQGVFRLVDYAGGVTVATLPVLVEVPATGTDVNHIAAAMEKATVAMMEKVNSWAIASLSK